MRISIVGRKEQLAPNTHEFAERRLLFALSRFDSKIDRVSMVIASVDGPRGGAGKSCEVTVKMRRRPEVSVCSVESDVEASIARAAHRAERAVARAIERDQQFDRRQRSIVDS